MSKLVSVCKCLCLLSLSVLFLCGAFVIYNLPKDLRALGESVRQEVAVTRSDVLTEVNKVSSELSSRADKRLASIQSDLNRQITEVRQDLTPSVKEVASAYAEVPAHIITLNNKVGAQIDAWTPYTNCAVNDLCLQKQAVRTMFSANAAVADFSRSANAISKAMPELTANVAGVTREVKSSAEVFNKSWPSITQNADQVTANVNRLLAPRWYDRLVKYGLVGATIYSITRP